jgi:NADH-quinone oxidoreductase subunit L
VIQYAWLVPTLPLLGAIVAAAGVRWLKGNAHVPVVAGIGAACVVALLLLGAVGNGEDRPVVANWLDAGDLHVGVELRIDGLTTMMMAMVTFVSTIIAVFASGYMAGDPGYPRFFAVMGLFVASMTGLVLSNNYVLTYACWEGVGVCSYLLVGFWHAKPSAAAAAKKAFLVNRIGDVGFAIAIFWMWSAFGGSLSYDHILDRDMLAKVPEATKFGIAALLFWAATAKSAQIPLYVWLPDAMEGPTPVSALIHAATMVTAGVYLIARSSVLLIQVPQLQATIAAVGCATALLSALIALTQTDLKRVLAYSTVSQLGYMFMGLGSGIQGVALFAVVAAMFHLFTHAFFKALLFLGSGSVMHSMGGVIDMRRFGGLRRRMPYTHATFLVGGLALAGIPPLAGFFSKDEVLISLKLAAREANESIGPGWSGTYTLIYWLAVLTAFLTAFYTGRAYFLTFWGPEKLPSPDDPEADPSEAHADPHRPSDLPAPSPHATDEPVPQHDAHGHGHGHGHDDHFGHESGWIMVVPLLILAVGAVLVGMVFGPTGLFEHHVARTPGFEGLGTAREPHDIMTPIVGTLVGVGGIALAWALYGTRSPVPGRLAQQLKPLYQLSYRKFWVDEVYGWLVVTPLKWLAAFSAMFDKLVVDGLVIGTARLPRFFGREFLAPFQNGMVQFYAAATALVLAGLLAVLLLT